MQKERFEKATELANGIAEAQSYLGVAQQLGNEGYTLYMKKGHDVYPIVDDDLIILKQRIKSLYGTKLESLERQFEEL